MTATFFFSFFTLFFFFFLLNSVSGALNASQHPVYLRRCGSMIPWPTIIPRLLFTADLVWGCIQTQRKPPALEHWVILKRLKHSQFAPSRPFLNLKCARFNARAFCIKLQSGLEDAVATPWTKTLAYLRQLLRPEWSIISIEYPWLVTYNVQTFK